MRTNNLLLLLIVAVFSPLVNSYAGAFKGVAIKTSLVKQKMIGKTLISYGLLEADPDQVRSLSLPHAGLINRIWIRAGQRVKQGDKLIEVITAPDARRRYLEAKSTVDFASRELQRTESLSKEQLATKTQLDAAIKSLKDAKNSLIALQLRGLDKVQEILTAPMDGIIMQLNVSQGQRIQANATAMLLAAEKRLIARLGVETEDLSEIHQGIAVTIKSVFVSEIKVESQIREVHAMINPRTRRVEILAAIPASQIDLLVLGSRVKGFIHLPTHQALMVPRKAVLGSSEKAFIFKIENSIAKKVYVRTGLENKEEIEIFGAVQAGDKIISLGNYEITDGMLVREIVEKAF